MTARQTWRRVKLITGRLFSRHPESDVQGVSLVDLRDDREFDHEQVRLVLDEALAHVRRAQGGFPELVNDHLRQVIAIESGLENASPLAQAFYTAFSAADRRNTFYLACRLVWAATYIRLLRNHPWWRRRKYVSAARAAATEAQVRFAEQSPDSEFWVRFLREHPN